MVELCVEALSLSNDLVTVVMSDDGEICGQYQGSTWQEWAWVDPTRVTLSQLCNWLDVRGYPVVLLVDNLESSGVN